MLYIKQIRERIGKTQQEVADYLKMQRPSYANIENNKRDPDTATILALSKYFHCSIDEIFGRDPARLPKTAESEVSIDDPNTKLPGQKTVENPNMILSPDEQEIITQYREFNERGKEKVREELYMMTLSGIYKNSIDVPGVEL